MCDRSKLMLSQLLRGRLLFFFFYNLLENKRLLYLIVQPKCEEYHIHSQIKLNKVEKLALFPSIVGAEQVRPCAGAVARFSLTSLHAQAQTRGSALRVSSRQKHESVPFSISSAPEPSSNPNNQNPARMERKGRPRLQKEQGEPGRVSLDRTRSETGQFESVR